MKHEIHVNTTYPVGQHHDNHDLGDVTVEMRTSPNAGVIGDRYPGEYDDERGGLYEIVFGPSGGYEDRKGRVVVKMNRAQLVKLADETRGILAEYPEHLDDPLKCDRCGGWLDDHAIDEGSPVCKSCCQDDAADPEFV